MKSPTIEAPIQIRANHTVGSHQRGNPQHDSHETHGQEQVEGVLPGLVGCLSPLREKGRPEKRVVAHGYISRGGAALGAATQGCHKMHDDGDRMRVRLMW